MFSTQNGTSADGWWEDAANGLNNTFVVVGTSGGDWNGANAGGSDFIAAEMDTHGNVLWRWQVNSGETCTQNKPAMLKVSNTAGEKSGQWGLAIERSRWRQGYNDGRCE